MSARLSVLLSFALMGCPASPSGSPEPGPAPIPASATPASAPASRPASPPAAPVPAPEADVPVGENRSGIAYVGDDPTQCDGRAPCPCAAPELFHGRNALARIGVDAEDLAEGTPCLLADFDGNGHTDAAFLGEPKADRRPAVVLLQDEVGLSATVRLPKPVSSLSLAEGVPGRAALEDEGVLFVLEGDAFRMAVRAR